MAFRISKRVPLSNHMLTHQVSTAWSELKRARKNQDSRKAAWFEDQMNAALDVLLARGFGRAPTSQG